MSLFDPKVLKAASPLDLLRAYESILVELRERRIMRTNDAPLGQWAEWLAHRVLGGTLERNSSKSSDLVTPQGRRVQVKSRLIRDSKQKGQRQLCISVVRF